MIFRGFIRHFLICVLFLKHLKVRLKDHLDTLCQKSYRTHETEISVGCDDIWTKTNGLRSSVVTRAKTKNGIETTNEPTAIL